MDYAKSETGQDMEVHSPDAGYVVQSNDIIRSIYRVPVVPRRLIYLATAALQQQGNEGQSVKLWIGDAVRALGVSDSGRSYREIRAAAEQATSHTVTIEYPNGSWVVTGWVRKVIYDADEDSVTIEFDEEILPYLIGLQSHFSVIDVKDFASLPGRHSQRIYELLMANAGHEGEGGNRPGRWWYRVSKDELRKLLAIKPNEYKATKDFRKKVVDGSVTQINQADIGLFVKVDYVRKGRNLVAFLFEVMRIGRDDPKPVNKATESESEDDQLIEANPELWEFYLREERSQLGLSLDGAGSGMAEIQAKAEAFKRLKKDPKAVRPKPKKANGKGQRGQE